MVYQLDFSDRLDYKSYNFTHPDNPPAEEFEALLKSRMTEDDAADELEPDRGSPNDLIATLERAGYVRAKTIVLLYGEGEFIEE
jgi:hypothetical protein